MQQYINLACKEATPTVYKPRVGKIHYNREKYGSKQIENISKEMKDLIAKFNYGHFFENDGVEDVTNTWLKDHNAKALKTSIARL